MCRIVLAFCRKSRARALLSVGPTTPLLGSCVRGSWYAPPHYGNTSSLMRTFLVSPFFRFRLRASHCPVEPLPLLPYFSRSARTRCLVSSWQHAFRPRSRTPPPCVLFGSHLTAWQYAASGARPFTRFIVLRSRPLHLVRAFSPSLATNAGFFGVGEGVGTCVFSFH